MESIDTRTVAEALDIRPSNHFELNSKIEFDAPVLLPLEDEIAENRRRELLDLIRQTREM